MRAIVAADLFCGAGGSSTGLVRACKSLSRDLNLTAINHWQTAVDTHARNHPSARHLCMDLGSAEADPARVIAGGRLDLLVASPECTHHSSARGGKPCSDQSRASAWHVLHWAEKLSIENILIENVREFTSWGPLTRKGRPNKRRKGETFNAFLRALESLGFTVDWRILNAADYGDATTRKRLFVQARRKGSPTWPAASHAGRWRAAREVIDWKLKGASIFDRKRPLSPRTMARIEAGLRKFGGEAFLAVLRGTGTVKHTDGPVPTLTAGGTHLGLCEPFIVAFHAGDKPPRVHSVEEPLPTQDTQNRFACCEPFVVSPGGTDLGVDGARSVNQPLPTVMTRDRFAVVEPFIVQCNHGVDSRSAKDSTRTQSVEEPLRTVTAQKSHALCQPFLVTCNHADNNPAGRVQSVESPMRTITAARRSEALVEPYIVEYYGNGQAQSVQEPLPTVVTHDRFALIEPNQNGYQMDIRFRMLQPHELAGAMSFDGYSFAGSKADQVRQIGNAVPVRTAQALCEEILRAR